MELITAIAFLNKSITIKYLAILNIKKNREEG
jgi:hypothetical protein